MTSEPSLMSTDLKGMLERVEAASGPDRDLDQEIATVLFDVEWRRANMYFRGVRRGTKEVLYNSVHRVPEFTANLQATMTLVERVLPGWNCSAVKLTPEPCEGYVWEPGHVGNIQGKSATPALALLAALLKAKASQS